MIRMKSRHDRSKQDSTSAVGNSHLRSLKERAMRRGKSSAPEVSLENFCSSDKIGKDASTPMPRVPRRPHEILRDLGMSDGEITEYFCRF
jgi:hypothetical protein